MKLRLLTACWAVGDGQYQQVNQQPPAVCAKAFDLIILFLYYSFRLALSPIIRWRARLFQLVRFVRATYGFAELKRCEQGNGLALNNKLAAL